MVVVVVVDGVVALVVLVGIEVVVLGCVVGLVIGWVAVVGGYDHAGDWACRLGVLPRHGHGVVGGVLASWVGWTLWIWGWYVLGLGCADSVYCTGMLGWWTQHVVGCS